MLVVRGGLGCRTAAVRGAACEAACGRCRGQPGAGWCGRRWRGLQHGGAFAGHVFGNGFAGGLGDQVSFVGCVAGGMGGERDSPVVILGLLDGGQLVI